MRLGKVLAVQKNVKAAVPINALTCTLKRQTNAR
jgi:hypothetical protein